MKLIHPNWAVPSNVHAVSTTRFGGFSQGAFNGLNLGRHVGDDPGRVEMNRQTLITELGFSNTPIWLNQVHGTVMVALDSHGEVGRRKRAEKLTADGAYTTKTQTVCVVMSADCLPLLLTNAKGTQVAAVHAGWRGLADGIIEEAINTFDCPPKDIIAWAGPCIGSKAFEVGGEVRDILGGSDAHYARSITRGKYLANLIALTGERLLALGVDTFSHSHLCTFSDDESFYSFRREGQCGRMASLIWMS